jgi:mandelate racemase/muconate lactonizing enzyme-like protein
MVLHPDCEMTSPRFAIRSVQALCYRYPLTTPVVTSFGRMLTRPAVFVRVEDEDGYTGWGEVWANFPSNGAEHRARLVNEVLAPAISGFVGSEPFDVFDALTQGTSVLALQSGEPGPFAQAIAGIDLAMWDLYARRRKTALWKLLGGNRNQIRVYASGINPTGSRQMAEAALSRGHRALKLKIGFDLATDRTNLGSLRQLVGDGMLIFANSVSPGSKSRSVPTRRGSNGNDCAKPPTCRWRQEKISRAKRASSGCSVTTFFPSCNLILRSGVGSASARGLQKTS